MNFRKWRRLAALLVLLFFCALFILSEPGIVPIRKTALITQITPNISHGGGRLLLVILFLALSLFFGRIYCSILCPAGLLQELFLRLGRSLRLLKLRFTPPKRPHVYWIVLSLLGLAAILGNSTALNWLDPVGMFGRLAAPIGNLLRREDASVYLREPLLLGILLWVLPLAVLAFFRGRWFCDRFCPVGALLGLASAYGGRRIVIDGEKCVSCGKCEKVCQTRCADAQNKSADPSRCVLCLDCLDACSLSAVSYGPYRPKERRGALKTAFAVLVGGIFVFSRRIGEAVDFQRATPQGEVLPPGTSSASGHYCGCVACQSCVPACPVGIIQPQNPEMRPVLDYNIGYCQYDCVACTLSCPAGVIRPLSLEEKQRTRIADTVLELNRCVVVTQGTACGACAEVCPTHAVIMKEQGEGKPTLPDFNPMYCIGCGGCYHVCPAEPRAFVITGLPKAEITSGVRPVAQENPSPRPPTPEGDGKDTLQEFPF